ncbi:PIN domain-containing protein [Ensifer aridi]|uniref:PIN domain-containing protein n=1 Tax=Ensifer aridi TaxID=1708715 RepID=UPI00358F012F
MPLTEEDALSKLLANGRVTALTVDTNIFDEKNLQLTSPVLHAITSIRYRRFHFILSGTVAKEVERHIEQSTVDALRAARKVLGTALAAFDTTDPTRDDLLEMLTGGRTPEEAAYKRFNDYLDETGCEVLDDAGLVDTAKIFDAYFAGKPPFGSGAKKNEFPDALALNALERVAEERGTGIMVISKDGDWRAFCEESPRLHLIPDLERALSLINDPPVVLKETVHAWLQEGNDGREELTALLHGAVEGLEFSVVGHSTAGDMEAIPWNGELRSVEWPEPEEIDMIEIQDANEGFTTLTLSIPLLLEVRVPIELEFSTWDSIDRETIGLGSRMIHVDEELDIRATVKLKLQDPGGENETVELVDCDLDDLFHEIDLGQVDVFDREDVWAEEK